MSFRETMEKYERDNNIERNEGHTGVQNLCKLVRAIGYKDTQYFGQFDHNVAYGDLIEFLEDNSGCVEAIKDWIAENGDRDWQEALGALTEEQIQVAQEALGNDELDEDRINDALDSYQEQDVADMQKRLKEALEEFEAAGGRGVELADEIDDLRICLAVWGYSDQSSKLATRGSNGASYVNGFL